MSNTPTQHGYKTQHYTVTALHTLNNTVAKVFNQMATPARTITVAHDMRKAFDTINTHTLIRKLIQTNIPGTITKFIVNYIKRLKSYTTYRNHTSRRQFNTGDPQGDVISPTPFNIYTEDLPPPRALVQMTSPSHLHTQARVQPTNTYNHTYIQFLPANTPKGSGSYLRPTTHIQHTHSQHLNACTHTSTNNKSTHRSSMGQTKKTLMATYKAVIRPTLEYALPLWLLSTHSLDPC